MYEDRTFENIMNEMLDTIEEEDVDKRPGSIIYDALALGAAKLAQAYRDMSNNMDLRFPDTATDDYLDKSIAWSGIGRNQATKSQIQVTFTDASATLFDIPLQARFTIDDVSFIAIEKIATGVYKLECETAGTIGNKYYGSVLPIDYIDGLSKATLNTVLINGTDKETDTSLYSRYQTRVSKPLTGDNKNQYEVWAREIAGVGKARTFPLWDGPGTVKVIIFDENMREPTTSLVQRVQDYIDPTQDGQGEGAAGIGKIVTIVGVTEIPIDISLKVILAEGATIEQVRGQIEEGATQYLENLAESETDDLVRITRIGNLVLDVPPVRDYENLLINGQTANIQIPNDSVAVLGTVTISE